MRSERWYWLPGFCCLALLINYVLLMTVRLSTPSIRIAKPPEIEITLQPRPVPPPKPQPEIKPIVPPDTALREQPVRVAHPASLRMARRRSVPVRRRIVVARKEPDEKPIRIVVRRPSAAPDLTSTPRSAVDPERLTRLKTEKPAMQGITSAVREVRQPRLQSLKRTGPLAVVAAASGAPATDRRGAAITPETPAANIGYNRRRAGGGLARNVTSLGTSAGRSALTSGNPLAGATLPDEKPTPFGVPGLSRSASAPGFRTLAKVGPLPGGGSPAPGRAMSIYSGAPSSEAPSATGVYGGSRTGGAPRITAGLRAPGGGGRTILSANNPLAKDAVPDDRPGLGPGVGGGGAGGRGGKGALASLHADTGFGGSGAGIGGGGPIRGRGQGTLAEQPGATGTGTGYGGGNGMGAGKHLAASGPGSGAGRGHSALPGGNLLARDVVPNDKPGLGPGGSGGSGDDGPGNGALTRLRGVPGGGDLPKGLAGGPKGRGGRGLAPEQPGPGGNGYGHGKGSGFTRGAPFDGRIAMGRGVPLGDTSGLLRGVKGLGDALTPKRTGGGSVHVVYLLDTSASMHQADKIGKAKAALKNALNSLLPGDSFNIINFDKTIHSFNTELVLATDENLKQATDYVDHIKARDMTFLSGAMETALAMKGANQMFLMSDGEPDIGIENFEELRRFVHERNTTGVQINTLALGTGELFMGMRLLKSLAEENSGTFGYVNLAK